MAELYWIHLAEHTDIFSEGYVGITKHTTKERYRGHYKQSIRKDRSNNQIISNAIRKYKDNLIVETIVISDIDYVLDLEVKVRPTEKIGWNLRAGGARGSVKGIKHTEEYKESASKQHLKMWADPNYARKRAILNDAKQIEDYSYLDENFEPRVFWQTRYRSGRIYNLWKNIPDIYSLYLEDELVSPKQISNILPLYRNHSFTSKILKFIKSGWCPLEDTAFMEYFQIANK